MKNQVIDILEDINPDGIFRRVKKCIIMYIFVND